MNETLTDRINRIQDDIAGACQRAGRSLDEVQLIAVSKTYGPEIVRAAADGGVRIFGESKVQEAKAKRPLCPGHLEWHLIGHLQSNKAKLAVQLFDFIHSIDSIKLLQVVERACDAAGRSMPVCLEVNVSGEPSKYGATPEQLPALIEVAATCKRVEVVGLMTIPPWAEDPEKARPYFAQLRALRERCMKEWQFPLAELSMGMSADFRVAIEEGATMVRVGTQLFGKRN